MPADYYDRYRLPVCADRHAQLEDEVGLYDLAQFAVRVSEDLAGDLVWGQGIISIDTHDVDVMAYSTLLHEMVHWWQYVGSTCGFPFALRLFNQYWQVTPHLRRIAPDRELVKPLYLHATRQQLALDPEDQQHINFAVNTWMDLEFASLLLFDPRRGAKQVASEPFFESQGHAYRIWFQCALELLAATFDREIRYLPDFRTWQDFFGDLEKRRVPEYYFRSAVGVPPIGLYDLFEAQARFHQLQFLDLASGVSYDWEDWDRFGLLGREYRKAVDFFFRACELDWPDHPTSPAISLFLLACDIAINPSEGYPDGVNDSRFVYEVQPGYRFIKICELLRNKPELGASLSRLDAEEYDDVAGRLCRALGWRTPREVAATVSGLASACTEMGLLAGELEESEFKRDNLPVRFLFALHLAFMQDKAREPEALCWPGVRYAVSEHYTESYVRHCQEVFTRHGPAFIAKGLKRRLEPSTAHAGVANNYYLALLYGDLVRQIIARPGPLSFDYRWLDPTKDVAFFESLFRKRQDLVADLGRHFSNFTPVTDA